MRALSTFLWMLICNLGRVTTQVQLPSSLGGLLTFDGREAAFVRGRVAVRERPL
jgi:hypothetical protein